MTSAQLRQAMREIGWAAGWLDSAGGPGRHTYTYEQFAHDLETLHPGLFEGRWWLLRDAMLGSAAPKAWWDKPVLELLDRVLAGRTNPPAVGPLGLPNPHTPRRFGLLVAANLQAWIEHRTLTQLEVAGETGISQTRLSKLMNGKTTHGAHAAEIEALASCFNVSPAALAQPPTPTGAAAGLHPAVAPRGDGIESRPPQQSRRRSDRLQEHDPDSF